MSQTFTRLEVACDELEPALATVIAITGTVDGMRIRTSRLPGGHLTGTAAGNFGTPEGIPIDFDSDEGGYVITWSQA